MSKDEIEALTQKINDLQAQIDKLKGEPPKPFKSGYVQPPNPIDRLGMSPSTMLEMARAVPYGPEIVAEQSRSVALPTVPATSTTGGSGWVEPAKLGPVPNADLVDAMVESFAPQRGRAPKKEG